MKRIILSSLALAAVVLVSGCQSNQLIFTTYTKVGVNITATGEIPNNLTFGYKRFEGAIIPVDPSKAANGNPEMPSVYAAIAVTNKWGKGLHIYQKFATGAAADKAASDSK